MFCENCGKPITSDGKFCGHCGNKVQKHEETPIVNVAPEITMAPAAPETPPKKRRGMPKPLVIILSIFGGLVITALAINLTDMFIINSAQNLEAKLVDNVWCSEPSESVATNGSKRMMSAYTIEFHDDGTATLTTYMASCAYYDELEPEDLEVFEREIVDWEISSDRTLEIDGEEYKCKTIMGDAEDRWYIDNDTLHINRTYYAEDDWGYVS